MKKKQYSTMWKNIAILLQVVLAIAFVLSIYLLNALVGRNVVNLSDLSNTNFLESGSYRILFEEQTGSLLDFLVLRGKFETDGSYNPDKLLNTVRYAKDGQIDTETTHVLIAVEDEEGNYTYKTDVSGGDLQMKEEAQLDFQTQMSSYRLGDIVSWAKTGYSDTNGKIEEKYLPESGISIEEALAEGQITAVQADNLYRALGDTLSRIAEEARTYKRGLNEFETTETNLSYIYSENGRVIYSNMGEIPDDTLAYARTCGSYLYYDSMELKFRTNISGMEDYFYDNLDGRIARMGNRVSLMLAVDTQFPQNDRFVSVKTEYTALHPWVLISIIALVVSLFGWVATLVYLTMAAGRTAEDENIHLNLFDRIRTELFFGIFVLLTVVLIAMSIVASEASWGIPGMLIMAGTVAFLYDVIFILFYLSMVRRIKAGVLWEYSLLLWFIKNVRRVLSTWKSSVRLMLRFAGNMLLFLVLTYGTFAGRSMIAVIGLFIYIGAAAIVYLRDVVGKQEIIKGIEKITSGDVSYKLPLDNLHGDNIEMAKAVNRIGDGIHNAVDESTKNERMKADLITNVSHDIKTPLTSIINYVNLLKMEPITDKRIKDYIFILDEKSQRLKQLTEDLVEASRISSGNITLQMTKINLVELIYQTGGEFNEKFEQKDLTTITKLPKEAAWIMADGRRIWRVVENLYNNVAKYAMAHTRVYVTMEKSEHTVCFSVKNISEQPLTVDSTELTERFIRGDESRTTEGSGLGLSIAQNLTTLMGGTFDIELDGDLFTVSITFPLVE